MVTALSVFSVLVLAQVAHPVFSASLARSPITSALSVGGSTTLPGGFTETLLAKAQPDECFNGIGNPYPAGPPCATGQPKVNQGYVGALTRAGNTLWFGTGANDHCLLLGTFYTTPFTTDSSVCEFGKSQQATASGVPAAEGDWRPPHVYSYDLTYKTLTDRTGIITAVAGSPLQTLEFRSAATIGHTIFLAGPSLQNGGKSVDVYALSDAGSCLGAWNLTQYDDISSLLVQNGVLYAGVHNVAGGGSVLRWTGALPASGTLSDASGLFTTVGALSGDVAGLALYNGRLFGSTFPEGTAVAALWMSPTVPQAGLTSANAAHWQSVWQVTNYEPDAVTASTYLGGPLLAFGGYLYWGTEHVPLLAAAANIQAYGKPADNSAALTLLQNTWRSTALFRGSGFGGAKQKVQLLYGESTLPAYVPGTGWQNVSTKAGAPLYGHSGFGDKYNNLTWSLSVYKGQLFVGTMDWSYLAPELISAIAQPGSLEYIVLSSLLTGSHPGADLYRFPSASKAASAVSLDGLGNPASYGIRNMVAGSDGLYLGMANPMNLLTAPGKPLGGWELIKVK